MTASGGFAARRKAVGMPGLIADFEQVHAALDGGRHEAGP
jgi:hypothetical protein